jgi:hypothetical protein
MISHDGGDDGERSELAVDKKGQAESERFVERTGSRIKGRA